MGRLFGCGATCCAALWDYLGDGAAMVTETARGGMELLLEEMAERRLGGADARAGAVERQHERGKLTARERLDILFDAGSFTEIDPFVKHRGSGFGLENNRPEGDAVVVGHGTVDGRTVFAYAQDFTLYGGSVSEAAAEKIAKVQDLAMKVGAPIVAINDGGGARIQEGVTSLRGYGRDLSAQHAQLRPGAPDRRLRRPGRGRRRLLAGDYGLHLHGAGHGADVHHRAGRDSGGERRKR